MMRTRWNLFVALSALLLTLALPVSAQPADVVDEITSQVEAIVELLIDVFSSEENAGPEEAEGNEGEIGIIVDPYG